MKQNFLRRLGALVLALVLALPLSALPAWADDDGPMVRIGHKGDGTTPTELTATLTNGPVDGTKVTYTWSCTKEDGSPVPEAELELRPKTEDGSTVTVVPKVDLTNIKVTVTAEWTDMDGTQSVSDETDILILKGTGSGGGDGNGDDTPPTEADSITVDKTSLTLEVGESETLTATTVPAGMAVEWSSSNERAATVDAGGKVTAVGSGSAVITAKAVGKDGGEVTAACDVTVTQQATGIRIMNGTVSGSERFMQIDQGTDSWRTGWEMEAQLIPATSTDTVEWKVEIEGGDSRAASEIVQLGQPTTAKGTVVRAVRGGGAGEVVVTASVKGRENIAATCRITVSGIVLNKSSLKMIKEQTEYLSVVRSYGLASGSGIVYWDSSNSAIVSVASGTLTAWAEGSVTITAEKNGYETTCTVTVGEDEDSVVGPYSASVGDPLVMSTIWGGLNTSSSKKTGSPIQYITNMMVPTSAGTLYYNYNSEANTGEGVGVSDAFYYSGSGQKLLSKLYFVPRQGFNGEAEITYNGWSTGGQSYAGVIKVQVNSGGGISYRTMSGSPATFLGSDFNAYCRSQTGRDLSYVTFTLPQSSAGTLYYDYTGSSQYGQRVSTSTQYGRSGRNLIDSVSFVPDQNYVGIVSIAFRGADTSGKTINGWVTINVVSPSESGDSADVYFSAEQGRPVTFRASEFYYACRATIGDSLAYVRFELPAYEEGVLYYNYRSGGSFDSRVDTSTRYYYSGTPGVSSVTFVPAANSTGMVSIPYVGYGAGGTTYTGTVYIGMNGESKGTIRYSLSNGSSVAFQVTDFNNVCLTQTGSNMDYVTFTVPGGVGTSNSSLGALYYNYRSNVTYNTQVSTGTRYYRTAGTTGWNRNLVQYISFHAKTNASTVNIPYYGYSTNNIRFEGTVVIQVGAQIPADAYFYGNTSRQVWLSSSTLRGACSVVMRNELSYIEITSLPSAEEGTLYTNYSGFGTGTKVAAGTKYYRAGSPSIDQISFVPKGGFEGTSVITYIGYSSNGQEQVSGKINVVITKANSSRYFNDMGSHVWAVDAVDYLYENSVINGVGGGRFGPGQQITLGDFTLMLVRTFGFSSNVNIYYADVPANSYYAQAISTARHLGIAGTDGPYFYPNSYLTRQDAMVMIRNAMVAAGRPVTNGLTADLSGFYDRDNIANYARSAVGSLVQMGVVKGDGNGRLRPTSTISRAETAMLMHYVMTL